MSKSTITGALIRRGNLAWIVTEKTPESHRGKIAVYKPRREASEETSSSGALS